MWDCAKPAVTNCFNSHQWIEYLRSPGRARILGSGYGPNSAVAPTKGRGALDALSDVASEKLDRPRYVVTESPPAFSPRKAGSVLKAGTTAEHAQKRRAILRGRGSRATVSIHKNQKGDMVKGLQHVSCVGHEGVGVGADRPINARCGYCGLADAAQDELTCPPPYWSRFVHRAAGAALRSHTTAAKRGASLISNPVSNVTIGLLQPVRTPPVRASIITISNALSSFAHARNRSGGIRLSKSSR